MKQKPWSLIVLAVLHILAPVGNLVLNAFQSGRSLTMQWNYWMKVIPLPLLMVYVGVPILAGIFILICKRWSYWAYLVCLGIIFISNLFSFWTHMSLAAFVFLVFILIADIIAVAYFVVPSVQKVYMDPRLRWWEAGPRYHFERQGFANNEPCLIKVLGLGGMLLSGSLDLKVGDVVDTKFDYNSESVLTSGEVVYFSKGVQANQYGIKFRHTKETNQVIRNVIDALEEDGKIVKERLPGPEDGFLVWLKKVLTTGKGLFPTV